MELLNFVKFFFFCFFFRYYIFGHVAEFLTPTPCDDSPPDVKIENKNVNDNDLKKMQQLTRSDIINVDVKRTKFKMFFSKKEINDEEEEIERTRHIASCVLFNFTLIMEVIIHYYTSFRAQRVSVIVVSHSRSVRVLRRQK